MPLTSGPSPLNLDEMSHNSALASEFGWPLVVAAPIVEIEQAVRCRLDHAVVGGALFFGFVVLDKPVRPRPVITVVEAKRQRGVRPTCTQR